MQCPDCRAENRDHHRFCVECGTPLAIVCPECGFANAADGKFCDGCGAVLGRTSARAEKAESQPEGPGTAGPDAERRQLTVLFCDLVGSTALSERLDPEALREVLRAYHETCADVIGRYDGHIARYIGDGLLVYFGYPQAHEDDAQRGVQAGLGIVEGVAALNERLAEEHSEELAVRVAVHTGLVVAGEMGAGATRVAMAIVGETPNIAARLERLAEPNTVLISASARRLVEGLFECDELGPQRLRGVSEPVTVFRVREESRMPSRFETTAVRGLTPLVGREEEIGLLLKRWNQAKDGEGQVVLLSGEPGVGKSRIVWGFRERLAGERHSRVFYNCSPYHRNSAFYPVIDQLERRLRFGKGDGPEQKLDKLDAVLGNLDLPVQDLAPTLASLLTLPVDERYPPISLRPQQLKKKALESLVAMIARMAARDPVLMVVEDTQWIDPSTLELLSLVIEKLQSARVLLLVTFRAEFEPPWSGQAYVTALTLNRLSRRDSAAIIARVTGGKALPDEVLDQIVAKTDGVPLFVEELTKTVLESRLLRDVGDHYELRGPLLPVAIPESLQDSLMARLDRLGRVKEVAQMAAVVGRTFSHELIAAVSALQETMLEEALSQLVDAGLVYRRGLMPDVAYEFKHVLVQDAAYGSLIRGKRQQLHKEIGSILEERFPHIAEVKPGLLAHHFEEAALPERAIPYAIRAGDVAAGHHAALEARARYQAALDMAQTLPPSPDVARTRTGIILKLANVALNREHFEQDLKNLELARSLAEEIGDKTYVRQILYWIGRTNYVLGRFDLGVEFAEKSLQLAEILGGGDEVTAEPVNLLARIHCLRGEPRKASEYGARNVIQMHSLGNRLEEAAVSGVLAFAYGAHGRFPQAFEAADHGVELAKGVDHLPTLAACFHFRGVVKGWYGDLQSSVSNFEETLVISEKAGDVFRKYLAHGWRGEAYLLAANLELAKEDLTQCLALGDQIGTSFHRGAFQAFFAKIRLLEGDVEATLRIIEEALQFAMEPAQAWSRSIALRIKADALLGTDPPSVEKAEDAVRAAIDIQQERECRCDLAWSHLASGHVFAAKGDRKSAEKAFAIAGQMFEEMGMRWGQEMARAGHTAA